MIVDGIEVGREDAGTLDKGWTLRMGSRRHDEKKFCFPLSQSKKISVDAVTNLDRDDIIYYTTACVASECEQNGVFVRCGYI
jgi:hypothetical protein